MPPAAEPARERVIAAVLGLLQGITAGAVYWHTTEKAVEGPHFHVGHMSKDLAAAKASYVVSSDQDEDGFDSVTDIRSEVELDIVAYRKFEVASEGPWDATTPKRGTVQSRLAADVKNCLRADEGLATLSTLGATRIRIPFTRFGADETLYKGWAVAMLRVVVEFSHGQVEA